MGARWRAPSDLFGLLQERGRADAAHGQANRFGISDFKKTAFYQNGKMGRLSYRRERIPFSILNVCLALLSFFPEMHLFGRNGPREYVEYTL